MSEITLETLRRILVSCAGESDTEGIGEDSLDTTFQDLGYDSLALMEMGAVVERDYGVQLPEDVATEAPTPRTLLDLINRSTSNAA